MCSPLEVVESGEIKPGDAVAAIAGSYDLSMVDTPKSKVKGFFIRPSQRHL